MTNDSDHSPKRTTSNKNLVNLKAVAALLEDSDPESAHQPSSENSNNMKTGYQPNEDLIQGAARIKSQRDLVLKRMKKMKLNQNRVSPIVFEKVARDYQMQLDTITKLLNEKKNSLKKELDQLYMLREQQELEITRHKEILEEARFRHFLEEYSEDQYKEVEEYETREIQNLQTDLSHSHSYIKVHEELFDPQELGVAPKEDTQTYVPAPEYTPPKHVQAPPVRTQEPDVEEPLFEKPAVEEKLITDASSSKPAAGVLEDSHDDILLAPESDSYFDAADEDVAEPSYPQSIDKKPAATYTSEESENIFDVLEANSKNAGNSPKDEPKSNSNDSHEPESTQPKAQASSPDQAPVIQESSNKGEFYLSITDGDTEKTEYQVKDNISLGRSPSNDVVLPAAKISRQHAAINKYKDQYILIDLKSSNGVYVNNKKIDECTLKEGDEIKIGDYVMMFKKN